MPVREDASLRVLREFRPEPFVLGGAGAATAVVAAGSVQGIEPPWSERERVPGWIETEVVAEPLSVGQVPLMVAGHRERDVPESPPRGAVALLIVAQCTVRVLVVPEGQDGVGLERQSEIRGGHTRLGSRTTDVSSRYDGYRSGRRRRHRRERRVDGGLERLSTSGHDRSDRKDRREVGNDREGDDPGPAAFLHATMMVDVGISTQAETVRGLQPWRVWGRGEADSPLTRRRPPMPPRRSGQVAGGPPRTSGRPGPRPPTRSRCPATGVP